jgi:hypothetical protein
MPHVTFIHGISNKPPADELSRIWRGALADNGLDLDAEGVSSSLVYWADLLYPEPLAETDFESTEDLELAGLPDLGMLWALEAEDEEARFVRSLAETIGYEEQAPEDPAVPVEPAPGAQGFERVPLPWFLKRRLMKVFLRDVHHYLFDAEFSPRPGEKHRIQGEIRRRTVDVLTRDAARPGPHVVVAHSLGTVIAYDCLRRVPGSPSVDALLTIGSPLGLDEVQDRLRPEWSRDAGYPSGQVLSGWANVFDRLDPVAGFDPELANDYRRDGQPVIEDIHEANWGSWRHSIVKYFARPRLRDELRRMLQLGTGG